jgi:hypothetical protein
MRYFIALSLLLPLTAVGQSSPRVEMLVGQLPVVPQFSMTNSNYPPCKGTDIATWNKCFATVTDSGNQYEGEFLDEKYSGNGTIVFKTEAST